MVVPKYTSGKNQIREGIKSATLFVENIPWRMQWRGLWYMFARHGEVIRTFIAKKLSRGGNRFGFVEFGCQDDANRAMERLNGFSTYGFRLTVKVARESNMKKAGELKRPLNEQQHDHSRIGEEKISHRNDGQPQKVINTQQESCKKVLGHVEEEELWRLQKCLIGETATDGTNSGLGRSPKEINLVNQDKAGISCTVDKGHNQELDPDNVTDREVEVDSLEHFDEMELALPLKTSCSMKKYGSLWALSIVEKKRRGRYVRRTKKFKEGELESELSGCSLSDSDLRRAKIEAKSALELGKKYGLLIRGSEEEAIGLNRSISDHIPVLLASKEVDWGPIPFKFINGWLSRGGCKEAIEKALSNVDSGINLATKLKKVKHALKSWNKLAEDNLDLKVKEVEKNLDVAKRNWDGNSN
ncbi:hypothetical protein GQ457_07G001200 [Hibiscus cannabinus]